jgi:prepilin-type N-terminal cleavage/methylation domain-containing protein
MVAQSEPENKRSERGLTIIELMVVISVIAILASVALPNLLSGRITANESAAVQTLKGLSSAQMAMKQRRAIDNDFVQDGEGEFGYFGELAATAPLRGTAVSLSPPVAPMQLGIVQSGSVTTSGYHFAMFMPGPAGVGVGEDAAGGKANVTAVDSGLAEQYWSCYAWPANRATTGNRVFMINQQGEVLTTDNHLQQYDGQLAKPPFDAAYVAPGDMRNPIAVANNGADGGRWVTIK